MNILSNIINFVLVAFSIKEPKMSTIPGLSLQPPQAQPAQVQSDPAPVTQAPAPTSPPAAPQTSATIVQEATAAIDTAAAAITDLGKPTIEEIQSLIMSLLGQHDSIKQAEQDILGKISDAVGTFNAAIDKLSAFSNSVGADATARLGGLIPKIEKEAGKVVSEVETEAGKLGAEIKSVL